MKELTWYGSKEQIEVLKKAMNEYLKDELPKYEKLEVNWNLPDSIEYPMPLTEKEEQAYIDEYNKNNPNQFTSIHKLTASEIIERYSDKLSDQEIEELQNYKK